MTRRQRMVAWCLLMWGTWAVVSTRDVPAAYVNDGLDGPEMPEVRDWVPAPPALALDAAAAQAEADAEVLAVVAKAEDPRAAAAVMHVVLNRARRSGRSLLAVATAPRQFHGWRWTPAARRWPGAADQRQLEGLRALARAVLAGHVADPTGGATHFHRQGSRAPRWAPEPARWRAAGRHFFYCGRTA